MDDTRELVDAAQVGRVLAALSAIAVVAAPVLAALGRRAGSIALLRAALLIGSGTVVFPLWVVYNRIEDHFGLDSVAALLINAGLFLVVGTGGGFLLRRLWPQSRDEPAGAGSGTQMQSTMGVPEKSPD